MNKLFLSIVPLLLLTACANFTLNDAAVTTTAIVKSAMLDWSTLSAGGNTTPEIDAKVIAAHRVYQQSAVVARDALVAYKNGGDAATYQKAFEAARVAMSAVLDLVMPLLQPARQAELQAKTGRATKL